MISSKVQSSKGHAYSQPEGVLGDSMSKFGRKLGEDNFFGTSIFNFLQFFIAKTSFTFLGDSLIEMGEALKQMAEIKYALEDNVKQNFLEPLQHLQTKDIRDVMVSYAHLKKNFIYNSFQLL